MRAQVGVEYLMIMGFVSLMVIPLAMLYFTSVQESGDEINGRQALNIARRVVDAAESVYYLGEPSQTTIKAVIPPNVQSATINSKEIVFKMKTKSGISDMIQVSSVNLTGSLPSSQGMHTITIKAGSDKVLISYS